MQALFKKKKKKTESLHQGSKNAARFWGTMPQCLVTGENERSIRENHETNNNANKLNF